MPLTPLAFIVSGAGAGLLLALAVRIAPWRRLRSNDLTHVFLGSTFALILLWSIRASVDAGFAFHLLGTAGLALVVGPALALVGGAIVVIVTSLIQAIPLSTVESRLPANLFVYLFVAGFFGAGLAMAAAAFAALGSLAAVARIARESAFAEFAPYIVYLAFGEATLTGMLLTLGVIYRPRWIATYDIDRYLPRPTR